MNNSKEFLIWHYTQGDDHMYQPSPTDSKFCMSWITTEDMDGVVDAEEYLLPNKRFFNQSHPPPTPQCHNAAVSTSLYGTLSFIMLLAKHTLSDIIH